MWLAPHFLAIAAAPLLVVAVRGMDEGLKGRDTYWIHTVMRRFQPTDSFGKVKLE